MNRSTRLYSGLGGMGAGHGGSKYEIRGVKKEKAKKTRLEKNSKSKSGRGAGGSRVTRKGNKRLPKRECGVRGAHDRIDREVGCVRATVELASGYEY